MTRPGIEPATSRSQSGRSTTEPLCRCSVYIAIADSGPRGPGYIGALLYTSLKQSRGQHLKAPYSSKTDILFSKNINKMWHLTPVKFELVSHSWNEMIFYYISELMLPILMQSYHKKKKIISFFIQLKYERLNEILQAVRSHILWSY